MTTKMADKIVLAVFVLVGLGYLFQSYTIAQGNPGAGFGPIQFPVFLGVALVVLCAVEFISSLRRRDDDVLLNIPNGGKLALTILLTAVLFGLWWYLRNFYVVACLFFFALVMIYQTDRTLRSTAIAAITAFIFTAALYVIFGLAFNVRLS